MYRTRTAATIERLRRRDMLALELADAAEDLRLAEGRALDASTPDAIATADAAVAAASAIYAAAVAAARRG